ncbi:hypothetical protein [Nannocystis bainbridge]|uniref:Uncharacterized protein n=1 Tax=Nannocystis bainbridge TaxID=2995303 RepID=A0ABT5DST8_9BACT|nr:hypothetical protein [Nannocystis bainbridge]MDC0716203.1 hypothetical protein [Nannocystis bainbridge]
MASIDRHRVARLMELSAAERTLKGPERLLREEDVAQLLRAAYDEASEPARAGFMARVKLAPAADWPWSAVRTTTPRGGGGVVVGLPTFGTITPPAALTLLLGQALSPDADPANRLPDRNSSEGAAWEPLYRALELWDIATIKKWWHPVGWVIPGAQPTAHATSSTQASGDVTPTNGGGVSTQPEPPSPSSWTTGRVALVAGTTLVITGSAVYSAVSLSRARELDRLSERLRAQEAAR